MMKDLYSFINSWLQAWTGNQPDTLLAFYTPDIFYADPAKPNGLRGHQELQPYLKKLLQANPNWEWKSEEIIPTEKGCVVKWKAIIPVGDENISVKGLDIVEIHDQKICRNEVFFDRTDWLKKTG